MEHGRAALPLRRQRHRDLGHALVRARAAARLRGLRGDNDGLDVDFTQSRGSSFYVIDNNSRPTVGGRVAATVDVGTDASFTLGASGMYGFYDPNHKLSYTLAGVDFYARLSSFQL